VPPKLEHWMFRIMKIALLLSLGTLASCGGGDRLKPLPKNAVILAFGDSLTFGTGVKPEQSYPSVLEDLLGRQVINAGIPGEVTVKGLARLPALLDQHHPNLVILIHGGNDMLRRQSARITSENLRKMITLIRSEGADVVMLGVPNPSIFLSAANFYETVAEETDTPIDTDAIADILQYPANKSDPIHPNRKGYKMLAQSVHDLLEKNGALID
jgi:acyl-CoA thioesterase I